MISVDHKKRTENVTENVCDILVLVRYLIVFCCASLLGACEQHASTDADFTLMSGITVAKVGECENERGSPAQGVDVRKSDGLYHVKIDGVLVCGGEDIKVYLTEPISNRRSLVLMENRDNLAFERSCDCSRKISLKIKDRLENHQTVYIVMDNEVIDSFLVP